MKNEKTVFKRWAQNLGLLFGSVILILLFFEIGVRIFSPQFPLELKGLYKSDPVLNIRVVPNYNRKNRCQEYSTLIQTNSIGLRDREYPEHDLAHFRILVLGDSFTFGIGVNLEDTYLKVLEKRLNEEYPGKKFEVINCGVPGVGTDYEYHFLKDIGIRFKPDLVLVGFFIGNDVSDTIFGHDLIEIKDGMLWYKKKMSQDFRLSPYQKKRKEAFLNALKNYQIRKSLQAEGKGLVRRLIDRIEQDLVSILEPPKNFLRNNSHAYLFLCYRYNLIRERLFGTNLSPFPEFRNFLNRYGYGMYRVKYPKDLEEAWALTNSWLKKIDQLAKTWGGKSVIVVIPSPNQVHADPLSIEGNRSANESNLFDFEKPQKVIKAFGDENGIPVCDLLPIFKEVGKRERLYYRYNLHWNKNGHRLAGLLIYKKLKADRLLPERDKVKQ